MTIRVDEIAYIRVIPSLLSSICSNTKLEQRLDSFVTKSVVDLIHYILFLDKLGVENEMVFRSALVMPSRAKKMHEAFTVRVVYPPFQKIVNPQGL